MNKEEFNELAHLAFDSEWPGFNPETLEVPNGDGKVDTGKWYSHVAYKYFTARWDGGDVRFDPLRVAYMRCMFLAKRVHRRLGLPQELTPNYYSSCLRFLRYPPGTGSHQHTDFDLFTLSLYRSDPTKLVRGLAGLHEGDDDISPGIHFGELAEEFDLRTATPHMVVPSKTWAASAVFFALPAMDVRLPDGRTVGEWLKERYARSRTEKQ